MEYRVSNNDFYQYNPLQPDQIRLLRFLETDSGLSGELKEFPLGSNESPPYKALSYVWALDGNVATSTHSISIGDKELPVLDSLQPFFEILRIKGCLVDNTWWWIDSISVDQRDNQEKSEQVQLMQSIYHHADETIVWLGPQSDDSNDAMDHISLLYTQRMETTLEKDELASIVHSNWTKLRDLLLRPWWTRMWTVQEYAVSNNVSLWCGEKAIRRTQIEEAFMVVENYGTKDQHNSDAFLNGWHRRRIHQWHQMALQSSFSSSLSLVALAIYFSNNGAIDKRDRLYALRGLATDSDLLEVDYTLSTDETYFNFAKSLITRCHSLDIICASHIFHSTTHSELPSWVPDWGTQKSLTIVPLMACQSASRLIGNFRPLSSLKSEESMVAYTASGEAQPVIHFNNKSLVVRGKVIDSVDGLAGTENLGLCQATSHPTLTQEVNTKPLEYFTSICSCLVLGRGDRYLQKDMPKRFITDFWTLCFKTITKDDAMVDDSFKNWLMRNMPLKINGSTLSSILTNLFEDDELNESSDHLEYSALSANSFMGRFYDTVIRMSRRLMVGESGILGMAPDAAQKGDTVCVLYGCSVPVVLRKVVGEEYYVLIGECFLEGFMSGEAVQNSRFLEHSFSIS
ncbi:MAG: hypothetical protein M1821_008359 [Bathelium mastoideum]|nr:MAG: hypothetical protein M1821_008359 [Bathelium mastoideum]